MRIQARYLKRGDVVWHNGEQRTVTALKWLNGPRPTLFGGPEGTKIAIELRLSGKPEKYYAYPAALIDLVTHETKAQQTVSGLLGRYSSA